LDYYLDKVSHGRNPATESGLVLAYNGLQKQIYQKSEEFVVRYGNDSHAEVPTAALVVEPTDAAAIDSHDVIPVGMPTEHKTVSVPKVVEKKYVVYYQPAKALPSVEATAGIGGGTGPRPLPYEPENSRANFIGGALSGFPRKVKPDSHVRKP
jgi:hypothetical protein